MSATAGAPEDWRRIVVRIVGDSPLIIRAHDAKKGECCCGQPAAAAVHRAPRPKAPVL